MAELPAGTVTFLFTDVEGSTRLLNELGDAYADVLEDHRRVLREAFVRHGGVEVDTQGDAFFVAFPRAKDALAAAADARDALATGLVRLRIGLHTGEPLVTREGYVGIDVHRAARIAAAGHGGQILVSQSTRELVGGDDMRDLGEHRLKDLTAPQRIYQLGAGDFPPLKSLNQTNLPVQPTSLLGRERELAQVIELVRSHRLVTLTGAGGSGKTRLALQASADLVEEFDGGAWFISLAALTDPSLVETMIASVVGAKDGLAEFLRDKPMLLVLDNLEQLLPDVASIVSHIPVSVIATSRERLNVYGEQEYPVPTLPLDEAVVLFTERARLLKPAFEPDEHVSAVAQRLDGLPLALELAAARVKVLTTKQIRERLGQSLELLTAGSRDSPERQRTLRATIEWSYDLLDAGERELFGRLAVFAGSFDLGATEAICDHDLDALESLMDKSLLHQIDQGRFFMLQMIREFAAERLESIAEKREVKRRHAGYFLSLIEALAGGNRSDVARARRVVAEEANLQAAMAWANAEGEVEVSLRLRGALARVWSLERRALFDSWATHYKPATDGEFPFGGYEQVLDRVAALVAERSPSRVLELGIGTGNLTRRLRERLPDAAIVGLDFSPMMVERAADAVVGVEVVIHDLSDLPLPDEVADCDVAAAGYVLHEFDDDHKLRLLSDLLENTLRFGGACVVGDVGFPDSVLRERARGVLEDRWDPYEYYFAAREFAAAGAALGLRICAEQISAHGVVLVVERI